MSAAAAKDYSTLQDIREEAGHQHQKVQEKMTGLANGSNKAFYVSKLPIVDRNYDDSTGATDVVVYDDGVAVGVDTIDPATGAINVTSAPANGSIMKCTYSYSTVNDTRVEGVRDEAIDYVQGRLNGIIDYSAWTDVTLPKRIRLIVRLFAAALIMIRSYGSNTDNELVSKDGYKKMELAEGMMDKYLSDVSDDSTTATAVSATVKTDGNLFARNTNLTETLSEESSTEEFFHKDN
jgi:hypothetical protein